jgi:hypothetical protein
LKNYIESYKSILTESEQAKLEGFLNVGDQPITSSTGQTAESQLESRINQLLAEIGKSKMTLQLRLQGEEEQTDSSKYNLNLQETITDLNTLYDESNRLDALITNHAMLNKAILSNISKDVSRLKARIDMLNLLADNSQGYGSANRENFDDGSMTEVDRETYGHLFVDRDGSQISESMNCVVDQVDGTLKLGTSFSHDRIHTNNGTTVATIEIIDQVGEGFSNSDPTYNIAQSIDGRADTFWGEVILSDGILQIPFYVSEADTIDVGALCKFKITFPNPVSISQFSFVPYCEQPIEICYVAYNKIDSNIIGADGGYCVPYNKSKPILTDSGITLDFPMVTAKCLIVMIRQVSAIKNYYTVTTDQKNNRELWSKIAAAERKQTLSTPWRDEDPLTINPSLTQDKVEEFDVRWQQYLAAQKAWEEKYTKDNTNMDVVPILKAHGAPKAPKRIQVEKYEYVYGAYEISVRGQEYNNKGIYVSKPHTVNGNVQTVVLEASEWHPTFLNSQGGLLTKKSYNDNGELVQTGEPLRRTSIEYYISPGESNENWIPILPLTQIGVNSELLIFPNKSVPRARTIFPIDQDNYPVTIYRDEIPLKSEDWRYIGDGYQTIEILPARFDPEAYYTIDYTPNVSVFNPYEIDFTPGSGYIGDPVLITEMFNAPGTSVIDKNFTAKLKYYPYVDRNTIAMRDVNTGAITPIYNHRFSNPVEVTLNREDNQYVNDAVHRIIGNQKLISGTIKSFRDPNIATLPAGTEARLLNMTNYFEGEIPVLNLYNPIVDSQDNPVPTFEYYHDGKKVVFTETFRHDGPIENYGASNGNAIVEITYRYLVSGVRCRIIMRRTSKYDSSVSPKVDWYNLKFKVLWI